MGFLMFFLSLQASFDAESSSVPSVRRGIPIEEYRRPETYPKSNENESGDTDFVAMAKDV
ncbi:hypothetical protein GLYMA_19G201366v4 [Glycine max]|nr:hypothetical protein GLYMA_19G201366v4 [Glycine max]KAG4913608.1 hypothetical protein JHK86_054041 [Glycine max]KAG4916545.1 hypothetical protein JHK87_054102 [Glycine soja]KAH1078760.1 hypothetical protein GYH30_053672 [Glycine max]